MRQMFEFSLIYKILMNLWLHCCYFNNKLIIIIIFKLFSMRRNLFVHFFFICVSCDGHTYIQTYGRTNKVAHPARPEAQPARPESQTASQASSLRPQSSGLRFKKSRFVAKRLILECSRCLQLIPCEIFHQRHLCYHFSSAVRFFWAPTTVAFQLAYTFFFL